MLKHAIAVLLLMPALGWAECGFVSSNNEMTIVVSKKSENKCFKSEQFRDAFRANLVAVVKTMDYQAPQAGPASARRRPPPAQPMPAQQAEMYYGQTAKR